MISWELHPFHTLGGTAYAVRRLADQLTALGVETRVLLPNGINVSLATGLLKPVLVDTRTDLHRGSRGVQASEFGRAALEVVTSDTVIAHSLEGAMFIAQHHAKRVAKTAVFWLHSLYDPFLTDLSDSDRQLLPCRTLLASAVTLADVVVTSSGVMKDAGDFAWPERLRELQVTLLDASTQGRVLTVESMGCLPETLTEQAPLREIPSPYIFFPGRPSIDKGLGIFTAIAERLRDDNITCVAVQRPHSNANADGPIHWLPWLSQDELAATMRNAACTVLPSITEGFGLAAAESINLGVTTLYQDVGGHLSLNGLPNAVPVTLSPSERLLLYELWTELFDSADYWSTWRRYETSLSSLIDKWVNTIRSTVTSATRQTAPVINAEQWATKLLQHLSPGLRVSAVRKPRLVHVLPWDLTIGGAQRMLDLWCTHDAHRWDTHIITVGDRGPFAFKDAEVHHNVKTAETRELIEKLQPDLLVHHEPAERNGIVSTCPQVWIVHCTSTLRVPPPRHARPVTVFSNFDADEIHSEWRKLSLQVLPLQIDVDQFYPSDRKLENPVCGIVGRLHEDKVPRTFVETLRNWKPGPWRLRFVGYGLESGYQQFVKEKLAHLSWVKFVGDVDPLDMPATLRKLDAVLIATDATCSETGSYSALEAMATGLPVVARELTGLKYNCGDFPLYANDDCQLLARLRELDDETERLALGKRGREFVAATHFVRKHVAAHSHAFADALSREVSILMPVFDTPANYLAECWESITTQTFREWELVLVDDGSREIETLEEIARIATDPRVVLVQLDENRGISAALNAGLRQCRAELVARMDADDKMLPDRLQRQFSYMQRHPDVAIVGTQMQAIEWKTEKLLAPRKHPEQVTDEYIQHQQETSEIWFLNHPTVMLRRREIMELGGYPEYRVAQDLGLWLRAFKAGLKIHNLPTVELHYRLHPSQTSTARGVRLEEYAAIVAECWTQTAVS